MHCFYNELYEYICIYIYNVLYIYIYCVVYILSQISACYATFDSWMYKNLFEGVQ